MFDLTKGCKNSRRTMATAIEIGRPGSKNIFLLFYQCWMLFLAYDKIQAFYVSVSMPLVIHLQTLIFVRFI